MESTTPSTPDAEAPLVRLRNVGKRFANGTLALQGMSLDIGAHDFISFLGPSGCGKSTALRLIAGLTRASSGEMAWTGGGAARTDRDLGFVFQEPTLMPWAKVFDNVWLPLKLAGMKRDAAAPVVQQVLEMVGLSRFADVYPRELSGGMKMRVSIARALVTHPRLLLMDEPFAALDEMTRIKLNNDLLAIWREHRFSVVFVTHSVYESVYLSNRIVVMAARPGRVIDEIRIDEPYPRGESFRTSSRYNAHCTAVSQSLHGALHGVDIDH
ncbi:ABC transporter ATP-binding protein [Variovorax sp.]|jgi:NitT/TauT family transport system ATP-binding protein|uniref:ABC transporter ATP-binding protein n=1 Tax=Variovorax sp. TaxID=1871043 RepID=UPI000C543C6B|nr:ABC transporter ATP-binding protein [Variovorax sp.]MBS77817.1 nitrate/sulfonate/bicarbonate ABC transporter ATP-binding protein [Variovorax sp.]